MAHSTAVSAFRKSSNSALSQTISPKTEWRSKPHPQSQCGFFTRLPREIRDQIYHEVIRSGKQPVRVCRAYDSQKNYRLRLDVKPLRRHETEARPAAQAIQLGVVGLEVRGGSYRCNPLAWVMSCQATYAEAFSLLYFVPTISIPDTCTFDSWCAALPPQALNKVKALQLDWAVPCNTEYAADISPYPATRRGPRRGHSTVHRAVMVLDTARWITLWDMVAAMKGLRNLQVKLKPLSQKSFNEPETMEILEPLDRMKILQGFSVCVAWHLSDSFMKRHLEKGTYGLTCAPKPDLSWR